MEITGEQFESLLEGQKKIKKEKHVKYLDEAQVKSIDIETFSIISDWYHYSILELFNLENFKINADSLSSKLNISKHEAQEALERLVKVKLIDEQEEHYIITNNFTVLENYSFTSDAMIERQKQILKLSIEKIEEIEIELRDHSTISVAVDINLLPEIKEKIKDFRRSLGNFIVKNSKRNSDVYELQISFFPVTNPKKI